jgi:hypothetical protein
MSLCESSCGSTVNMFTCEEQTSIGLKTRFYMRIETMLGLWFLVRVLDNFDRALEQTDCPKPKRAKK